MPTLLTLLSAPASSPLAEVNADNVAELLIRLTDVRSLLSNQGKEMISDIVSRHCETNDIHDNHMHRDHFMSNLLSPPE